MLSYRPPKPQPTLPFYHSYGEITFASHPAVEPTQPQPMGYERDSAATGIDLKLIPGDDLTVSSSGDLELQTGSRLIEEALSRRLATPPAGYRRFVLTGKEVTVVDEGYGNPLYELLSANIEESVDEVAELVRRAAQQEKRVDDVVVTNLQTEQKQGQVFIELRYRIKSNQELYDLSLELNYGTAAY